MGDWSPQPRPSPGSAPRAWGLLTCLPCGGRVSGRRLPARGALPWGTDRERPVPQGSEPSHLERAERLHAVMSSTMEKVGAAGGAGGLASPGPALAVGRAPPAPPASWPLSPGPSTERPGRPGPAAGPCGRAGGRGAEPAQSQPRPVRLLHARHHAPGQVSRAGSLPREGRAPRGLSVLFGF